MSEVNPTSEVCYTCKYNFGGDDRIQMCGYYLDTGKHRCDDFFRKDRKANDRLDYCDKYEPRNGHVRDKCFNHQLLKSVIPSIPDRDAARKFYQV